MALLFDSFGQINGYEFKRKDLKGFKKVTSTRTNYNGRDSTSYSSIYFVNDLGDIARSEHYDKKELTNWTLFEYDENGRLKYEESHGQIFSYDDKTKKEIGQIQDNTYHGRIFEYDGDLLTKQIYVACYDGSKSYNYFIFYEYDNSGRLIKEVNIDGDIGLTGDFKPNSSVIDTIYYKDKITKWTTTHLYKADSIISIDYNDNNDIQGYSFTKLDQTRKPINILDTDAKKNEIKSVTRIYDKKGNLTQEITKIIDLDKITYDLVAGDTYQVLYNERSLPILGITKENGKLISKEILRYN